MESNRNTRSHYSYCLQVWPELLFSVSAEEPETGSTAVLRTTVVTAPRFSTVDINVASRVQIIDAIDIEESGANNLVELLNKEANLHFRSTSGNSVQSQVSIGGFGENSALRTLVLLDGHRLNTADQGAINWLSLSIDLIESVEVVKGGQSGLYGNNAVGGVIKITTRKPQDDLSGVLTGSLGSFGTSNGRATVSGRVADLGYMAYVERIKTDGYRENSQYEGRGGGFKLDWTPAEYVSSYFSFSAVSSDYGLPGDLSRAQYDDDPWQSTEPDNYGEDESYYARGGFAIDLSEYLTLSLDAGYTERELFTDFVTDFFALEQDYEIVSFLPSLTYEKDGFVAVAGLDYYDDSLGGSSIITFPGFEGETPFLYERENIGGYVSASLPLGEEWSVSGSLRAEQSETTGTRGGDRLNPIKEDQHAWSLGLNRLIGDNARIYGSVRRFYRYPATDEIFVFGPPASFNAELEPESGYDAEIGGDWAIGDLTIGGRVFHQRMRDEIVLNVFLGVVGENVNLERTKRWGADLFATYAISRSLDVSLKYSWVDAEIDSGEFDGSEVPLVPEHKVRAVFDYRPVEAIRISAGATYTHEVVIGSDFANELPPLEDYTLLDLSVSYMLSENIEIFATGDNLTDEKYKSTGFANRFGTEGFYPGMGINGQLGVRLRF
jgi:iron complex outermembrane receptor protein